MSLKLGDLFSIPTGPATCEMAPCVEIVRGSMPVVALKDGKYLMRTRCSDSGAAIWEVCRLPPTLTNLMGALRFTAEAAANAIEAFARGKESRDYCAGLSDASGPLGTRETDRSGRIAYVNVREEGRPTLAVDLWTGEYFIEMYPKS